MGKKKGKGKVSTNYSASDEQRKAGSSKQQSSQQQQPQEQSQQQEASKPIQSQLHGIDRGRGAGRGYGRGQFQGRGRGQQQQHQTSPPPGFQSHQQPPPSVWGRPGGTPLQQQQPPSASAMQLQWKSPSGDAQQPGSIQPQKAEELSTIFSDQQPEPAKSSPEVSAPEIAIEHGGGSVQVIRPQEKPVFRKGGTMKIARKAIHVLTNHFPLKLGKITSAIHYDVAITPDRPKKLFREVMAAFREDHYPNRYPAFDGSKNLYSTYELCPKILSGKVKVLMDERVREFEVTIKPVANIDLSILNTYFENINQQIGDKPMQALQCLDVILRSGSALHCIPVGRSFFNTPIGFTIKLGDGTELYNGFYQSVVLGWKPFLNLDVAHKAFPMAINVIDFIKDVSRDVKQEENLKDWVLDVIGKQLKELKVQYEIPKIPGSRRIYRIHNIYKPANQIRFKDDAGVEQTVEEYFAKKKKYRIMYPNWPTLWVGNKEKHIYIPAELCTILSGQAVNKKMTEKQTQSIIKYTAISAPDRLQKIKNSMNNANFNMSREVKEFNITVSDKPQQINARVLEPPTLTYHGKIATPGRGAWNGHHFFNPVKINSWTIISMDSNINTTKLEKLEKYLIESGRQFGVSLPNTTRNRDFPFIKDGYNTEHTKKQLADFLKNTKYELTVIVIPDYSKKAYSCVKQAAEITVGTLTQCIRGKTVNTLTKATADNILLKINAKLNGTNHVLSRNFRPKVFNEPVVIMGADVTHPSPDAQNIPSVAAVTCSYDVHAFKYIFSWRLQEPKLEIIKDLETIVMEQLRHFRNVNKDDLPHRIIFFRDGVSDGEFNKVLSSELQAIRNACTRLNPDYKPRISFFIVQKRHHTRLFPMNCGDSEDKNGNVPVGTCVDTIITRPTFFDFYLVSHASIRGVARPTKYVPLWDDSDMSEDDIQQLTFYLCHLYARCNRSVSYPAPTYYAHLAAARAKVYIETEPLIDLNKLERLQDRLQVKENMSRGLSMYFV